MKVFDIKSLNERKIKILTKKQFKKTSIYEIEYDSSKLLIQTPKGVFTNKPKKYTYNKNLFFKTSVLYNNYSINTSYLNFIKHFQNLEIGIMTSINKFFNKQYKFKYSINKNSYNNKAFLNLNIQMYNNKPIISVFDSNKFKKTLDYIIPLAECINIIYLKNIWIKDNIIGLNWLLLQTKVNLPFIDIQTCLIVEDGDTNYSSDNYSENMKIYNKYIMMKKVGVLGKAIHRELIKNKLSYDIFLKLYQKKYNCQLKSEINSFKTNTIKTDKTPYFINTMPKFTPNMLSSVKLKKTKNKKRRKKHRKNKKSKSLKNIDTKRYRPPTSNQLHKLLKKLKKSNFKLD